MANANRLVINITGDPSEFQNSLGEVSASTKTLEQNLSQVAKASSVAFVGLSGAVAASIATFREQEKVENQLNAVIKSTGGVAGVTADQVKALAKEIQGVTTFGDEAVISSSNLLLTFKEVGEKTFPRAQKAILDLAVATDTGLKEATIQLGKALNDPIQGLSALRRVGIQFTKDQEAQIKVLTESGNIIQAQNIILEELESQFRGSAEAAAQGTGVFIQLKNAFLDLVEAVGMELSPILEQGAQQLKRFITFAEENEGLVRFAAITLGVTTAIAGITAGFSLLGLALLKLPPTLAATNIALRGTTTAVRGLVGATGFGLLLLAIPLVIQNLDELQRFFRGPLFGAFEFINTILKNTSTAFFAFGRGLKAAITGNFTEAISEFKTVAQNSFVPTLFEAGKNAIKGFRDGQADAAAERNAALEKEKADANKFNSGIEKISKSLTPLVTAEAKNRGTQIIDIQSNTSEAIQDIDLALADSEVDIFEGGTAGLVNAATDRQNQLVEIERQGFRARQEASSGAGGGGGIQGIIQASGLAGGTAEAAQRRARSRVSGSSIERIIGRAANIEAARQRFIERFGEENASKFQTRGRLFQTTEGRQNIDVNIGFSSREAERILTAEANKQERLGTRRSVNGN